MDEVNSAHNESANLRKIQNNLLKWDTLAPLTKQQELIIYKLSNSSISVDEVKFHVNKIHTILLVTNRSKL